MTVVRPANAHDAGAIARVEIETWRSAYAGLIPDRVLLGMSLRRQSALWRRTLRQEARGERVLVAERPPFGVVGFGSCGPARNFGLPFEGEVYTLYIHPDHQGAGIGRRLLRGLFDLLLDAGHASALVWVLAGNPSRFFYEAMGGARVAVREEPLGGAKLAQTAYGWPDLKRVPRRLGPRAAA